MALELTDEDVFPMMPPYILQQIRFAVREATAFVGHSFAEEDAQLIEQIKQFLSKLGVKCDSGKRAEPKGVATKLGSVFKPPSCSWESSPVARSRKTAPSLHLLGRSRKRPRLSQQASVCCCSLKMGFPISGACKATTNTFRSTGITSARL